MTEAAHLQAITGLPHPAQAGPATAAARHLSAEEARPEATAEVQVPQEEEGNKKNEEL